MPRKNYSEHLRRRFSLPVPCSNLHPVILLKYLPGCVLDSFTLVLIYTVIRSPTFKLLTNSVFSLKKSTANPPLNSLSVSSSKTIVCFSNAFTPIVSFGQMNFTVPVYCMICCITNKTKKDDWVWISAVSCHSQLDWESTLNKSTRGGHVVCVF